MIPIYETGKKIYPRLVERQIKEALADTPVVLIIGPRRAGKTTLARMMAETDLTYCTLDDRTIYDVARSDPTDFIRNMNRAIIDEVQRVPELFLEIKKSVDEDYRPGRFLLTGSANVMALPRVADSLAGRIESIQVLPLTHAEIKGGASTFLDCLFTGKMGRAREIVLGDDLVQTTLVGGFPEALARENERRQQAWTRSWLSSVLSRDLRDIAEIEKLTELPKFVQLLAEHSGQLINYSEFGSNINVSHKTAQRYVRLLEQIFLISTLQPWYTNELKRIVKTPKLHFIDSGLLATIRGLTFNIIKANRKPFCAILKSFVFSEILKLISGSDLQLIPYHFRDQ